MKVYIVVYQWYEDFEIDSVYLQEEEAESKAQTLNDNEHKLYNYPFHVEEWEVNE